MGRSARLVADVLRSRADRLRAVALAECRGHPLQCGRSGVKASVAANARNWVHKHVAITLRRALDGQILVDGVIRCTCPLTHDRCLRARFNGPFPTIIPVVDRLGSQGARTRSSIHNSTRVPLASSLFLRRLAHPLAVTTEAVNVVAELQESQVAVVRFIRNQNPA